MNRLTYIDRSKGLIILLMLFAHTSLHGVINTWIFSFHMQFFFIICGLLLARKKTACSINYVLTKLRKRAVQLGIPYLVFCLLLTALYSGLSRVAGNAPQTLEYLKRILFLQGIDSLWFIPVYFFSELMMLCLLCLPCGLWIVYALSLVITVALTITAGMMPEIQFLRFFLKCLIGFVFICYGYALGKTGLLHKIRVVYAVVMLLLGAFLSSLNGFAAIGSLQLGNGILFFMNALLTSTSLLVMCIWLDGRRRSHFLEYFGQNTIVILCTNNLLIESIRLLDHLLFSDRLLQWGIFGSIIFTILLVLIEIPLIRLANGPFAVLFGKRLRGNET